jgi:hypothetical protein
MSNMRVYSKLMRRIHLLIALFLTPWITMYASSTLVMHHRELFTGNERRVPPDYEIVSEETYQLPAISGHSSRDIAEQILSDIGALGAYSVQGTVESGKLVIDRHRTQGALRITFDVDKSKLTVEKQRFGLAYFLEMLHRRHGFSGQFVVNKLWAVSVDVVIVAIGAWSITGLWMWLCLSRARRAGAAFLLFGSGLFAFLLFML